jgi:hypothetical protein
MLLRIKEILFSKDIKTPPKYLRDFSSSSLGFKYSYATCSNSYVAYYQIKISLEKDFSIFILWDSCSAAWDVSISANGSTLKYFGKYYSFHPDLKRLIDLICNIAHREYLRINRLDKINIATKEIKIFKDIIPKLEKLDNSIPLPNYDEKYE